MKKNLINEMEIRFAAKSENECFARQVVCSFASQLDPTLEELSDLRIIVSEAVTNSIVHAYRNTDGDVRMNVRYYDDRSIRVRIRDDGCGIEDIEKCMQPLYTTDPSGERGGMGFPIMQNLSDSLKVRSVPGKGTVLTIIKKFGELT